MTKAASTSTQAPLVPAADAPKNLTSRPARKQVTNRELENLRGTQDRANQTGLSYNIWYNKWSGGDQDDGNANKTRASTRVNVARDVGYTRADAVGGAFICLFFARGYCPNGADCTFMHILPNEIPEQGHDIFGRAKHGDYRDDMGGVGSLQKVNRTLYVGRITEEADHARLSANAALNAAIKEGEKRNINEGKGWDWSMPKEELSATEKVLYRHFSEFGELERVRVLHMRGCGFITFHREVDAQFAKEAMMNQSLDHEECINLRWATDDPNPVAKRRDHEEREKLGIDAIRDGVSEEALLAGQTLVDLEEEDGVRSAKRLRLEAPPDSGLTEEEYQRLLEENQRNWELMEKEDAALQEKALAELEGNQNGTPNDADKQSETHTTDSQSNGLVDHDALKRLHALRQKKQPPKPTSALSTLAGYGSDSDDE